MKLTYNVGDKPKFSQLIVFAFQQLLAIMAATIAVPAIISGTYDSVGEVSMSMGAALFGAGVGTLVYVLFTARVLYSSVPRLHSSVPWQQHLPVLSPLQQVLQV